MGGGGGRMRGGGREEEGKGGRGRGRGRTGGGHHFIGLLGMFTLKKCGCSSLRWCLLVRGRVGGGGGGGGEEEVGGGGEGGGGEGERWQVEGKGKGGRWRERGKVAGGGHHFIGLLGMFTLKKYVCSSLGWWFIIPHLCNRIQIILVTSMYYYVGGSTSQCSPTI